MSCERCVRHVATADQLEMKVVALQSDKAVALAKVKVYEECIEDLIQQLKEARQRLSA